MKKTLIIIASLLAFAVVASAQPRAIGVRAGYGAELSYQHNLGSANFLEVDLGWSFSSAGYFNVAAAYDFSVAPVGPFNFYAGPALVSVLVLSSVLSISLAKFLSRSPLTGGLSSGSSLLLASGGIASVSVSDTHSDPVTI